MYMVESKGGAIGCMFVAIIFLGSWPAIMNHLERRGRHPQHTYLDDSIITLLVAVIIAFTLGEIGTSNPDMPNFTTQIFQFQNNWPCVLFAITGGVFQSLGNLSTQYAWAFVGLSVTEVITSSIAVVIGTTVNYFLDKGINKAAFLFSGVGCFLLAVGLGGLVHFSNSSDNEEKLTSVSDANTDQEKNYSLSNMARESEMTMFTNILSNKGRSLRVQAILIFSLVCILYKNEDKSSSLKHYTVDNHKGLEQGIVDAQRAKVGSAEFLRQLENKRAIKVFGTRKLMGLAIAFVTGVCFSLYSPAINLATNDHWNTMKEGVPHLVVYTAFFYYEVSCSMFTMMLNIYFLYNPVLNLPRSSMNAYLRDWNGRAWAITAGLLCGIGSSLQFMGGQAAGYAAADSVQALPLVSTFWGILLFGEYRRSSKQTYMLLGMMLLMFSVATGLLMASSGHRQ